MIDAVQFNGRSPSKELIDLYINFEVMPKYDAVTRTLLVNTLEGYKIAVSGDWIIKGLREELYPCNPDIFALTYEEVK